MADDYTPTTEEVREQYTREEPPRIGTVAERRAEFDRWLAAHDAQVRADERERIASAIEALRVDAAMPSPLSYRIARDAAARIARDGGGER